MEQKVIVLEEAQPADPGHMLVVVTGTSGVPAWSPEVEAALQPVAIKCRASESEKDSTMDLSMEGLHEGLENPILSLQSAELPLGQGTFRQKFEQWSH